VTISGEDVREPKPRPEAYLMAAAALGISAQRCAVVEDSERGYRAAIDAGCIVVVLNRHGRELHRFSDAAAVTTSMPQACDVRCSAQQPTASGDDSMPREYSKTAQAQDF